MNKVINSKMYDTATAELIKKVFFGEIDDRMLLLKRSIERKTANFSIASARMTPTTPHLTASSRVVKTTQSCGSKRTAVETST